MQSLNRDWEKLSAKASTNHSEVIQGVDQVIAHLELLKDLVQRDGFPAMHNSLEPILSHSKATTKSALQAHKEYHSLYSKWQKMIDKKFNQTVLPLLGTQPISHNSEPPKPRRPFESESARLALHSVITNHLLRQGRFDTACIFAAETQCTLSTQDIDSCRDLYRITDLLRAGDLSVALEWAEKNREWLDARDSPLEFDLRRSEFIRLLTEPDFSQSIKTDEDDEMTMEIEEEGSVEGDRMMESVTFDRPIVTLDTEKPQPPMEPSHAPIAAKSSKPPSDQPATPTGATAGQRALEYGQHHFPRFFPKRWEESVKLTAAVLFTPLSRLKRSPYAEFFQSVACDGGQPWVHAEHLVPLFIKEYCARLEWSKELPLTVATDLGSGGALAKIAKVRSVMKEKRTEWSQADELPVEIPLPTEYRFHSVFACPVSKEQATEANPPMMMPCGHVIAKESMQKLAKGGGTVKCPYCPSSASMNSAIQVYF